MFRRCVALPTVHFLCICGHAEVCESALAVDVRYALTSRQSMCAMSLTRSCVMALDGEFFGAFDAAVLVGGGQYEYSPSRTRGLSLCEVRTAGNFGLVYAVRSRFCIGCVLWRGRQVPSIQAF